MKAITIYQSDDGSRFPSAEQCQEYERLCTAVSEAMKPLGPYARLQHGCWIQ